MEKISYCYNLLFISACRFSSMVRAKGEPHEIAYWWVSFLVGINLVSAMMLISGIFDFKIRIGTFVFIILFFLPPFIFNYYFFINKNNRKVVNGRKVSSKWFVCYMLFTVLFFVITGYLNIP